MIASALLLRGSAEGVSSYRIFGDEAYPQHPLAIAEFRVVAEQISTRDLVQEYLANRVSPTLSEWSKPKLNGTKKKNELVRLPYRFKFEK
jgi:hypothetical protein